MLTTQLPDWPIIKMVKEFRIYIKLKIKLSKCMRRFKFFEKYLNLIDVKYCASCEMSALLLRTQSFFPSITRMTSRKSDGTRT